MCNCISFVEERPARWLCCGVWWRGLFWGVPPADGSSRAPERPGATKGQAVNPPASSAVWRKWPTLTAAIESSPWMCDLRGVVRGVVGWWWDGVGVRWRWRGGEVEVRRRWGGMWGTLWECCLLCAKSVWELNLQAVCVETRTCCKWLWNTKQLA